MLIIADQLFLFGESLRILASCFCFLLLSFTSFSCSLRPRCFYVAPTIALQLVWTPLLCQVIPRICLLRQVPTQKSFTLPAAMLTAHCLKLAGKLMCRPLPFWLRWSRLLNRRWQPIKLQRVLKQVQAWLGTFPRHSRPACSPKHRPWQFLVWASTSFGFYCWSG